MVSLSLFSWQPSILYFSLCATLVSLMVQCLPPPSVLELLPLSCKVRRLYLDPMRGKMIFKILT